MPVHDWSRVEANLFHDFHQTWTVNIRNTLNGGLLPAGYSALVEQHSGGFVPDVLTLERRSSLKPRPRGSGGAVLTAPPPADWLKQESTTALAVASLANRIVIRHSLGRVVCVMEIVSPGNKNTRSALDHFVNKTVEFIESGVHVLVVDLFPPSKRDPQGIHKAIWDRFDDQPFNLPPDKPLTLAAYVAAAVNIAYVRPVGFGEPLPDMPAWLDAERYVPVPLESTYQATWLSCPEDMREVVEHGLPPDAAVE